jgi:hypothetical protein
MWRGREGKVVSEAVQEQLKPVRAHFLVIVERDQQAGFSQQTDLCGVLSQSDFFHPHCQLPVDHLMPYAERAFSALENTILIALKRCSEYRKRRSVNDAFEPYVDSVASTLAAACSPALVYPPEPSSSEYTVLVSRVDECGHTVERMLSHTKLMERCRAEEATAQIPAKLVQLFLLGLPLCVEDSDNIYLYATRLLQQSSIAPWMQLDVSGRAHLRAALTHEAASLDHNYEIDAALAARIKQAILQASAVVRSSDSQTLGF